MDVEPVLICGISEDKEVRPRIEKCLLSTNDVVPTPDRADEPGSAILERLGLRKWRAFETDAIMFNIYLTESGVEYYSTGPAVGGEWKVGGGKHISLSADTDRDRLVQLIIAELLADNAGADAGKAGGLMLLPPPAEQ